MSMEKKWYALLIRSHCEKIVCQSVLKKSIDVFAPTIKKQSRRKDRNIMIDVPLFPGYIFVNIFSTPAEQLKVLKTFGAIRILGYNDCPVAIPAKQIESLKIITGQDKTIITGKDSSLTRGESVIVTQGVFAGLQGEFLRYKGKERVIIKLEALGQFAGVEINKEDLEKLPDIMS